MTNSRVVIACLLSWLLFLPAVTWVPLLYVLDFVNALGFTFGTLVLWRYAPGAFWALRCVLRGQPIGRGSMLVLGIVKTWLAMVIRTLAIWRWRWLGEPVGGLDSFTMALAAWLIIGGGVCHLVASTMPDDRVECPQLSGRFLWGAIIAGLTLGACIAYGRFNAA